jgi:hypothetical protein
MKSSVPGSAVAGLLAACLVSLAPVPALAVDDAFVPPTNWTRSQAGSTYQEWDVFGSATGNPPNLPDVGLFNPNAPSGAGLNVYDATQAAFITSDSNIYTYQSAIDVQATVPSYNLGPWYQTVVIAQTQTIGTELDYSNITVNGVHALSTVEISRAPFQIQFADNVFTVGDSTRWVLSGSASSYTFDFPASSSSSAFDRLAIDTYTTLTGDVTGDGRVDIQDLTAIANDWLASGVNVAGDANFDGRVDIQDLTLVANNWLHSAASAPPNPPVQQAFVPEPATWTLLLTGALAIGLRIARRGSARRRV